MEFRRSSAGFLGFTINEAGVVEKVDGLARNSGLQPSSRLLQVGHIPILYRILSMFSSG